MANIKEAMQYVYDNPTSDFAKSFEKLAASGALNIEAKQNGIDLSPFQPTPVVEQPKKDGILKSIAKDVAGTLAVNPISRATEAITRTVAPNSLAAKGYEQFAEEGQGQDVLGVNVPTVTGGKQITGEALKTASYLFPYGKVAGLAGKGIGKIAGNVASGALGGYTADVGYGLTDKEQTIGEALIPGAGTAIGAAIPLVGPTLRGTGRLTAKTGEKIIDAVIPADTIEAKILQTYKKNNPFLKRVGDVLKGTEKVPTTAGKTVTTEGLMGTKTQIGVQARRAQDKIWENVISPRLKASEQAVDLDGFFAKIQDDIITNNPEISRQKSLLNALNSFKDDYAGINSVSLEKLQKLKEGWAEFVPEKFYKGENIAGNAKQVQALMADEARQTIYSQLGDDVKQAYFDYGNLKGIADMGITSMTGQKLKGGAGSFTQEIFSQAVTPVGTVGGQAVYRLGKGIEFIGNLGAKNLGEALGVNLKFPGDAAVDDISASLKKVNKLPNKQGGFIKVGQDAKAPMATQTSQTATKAPIISKNVIPKSSPKSPTKSIDPLISEAKKYKSAEEFVKAQGTPVYHGTDANFTEFDIKKSGSKGFETKFKDAIYVSPNKSFVKQYGKNTIEGAISPNAKVIDYDKIKYEPRYDKFFDKYTGGDYSAGGKAMTAKEEFARKYFDVVKYGENEYVVLNPNAIKTKSQLTDIWNKANKK